MSGGQQRECMTNVTVGCGSGLDKIVARSGSGADERCVAKSHVSLVTQ